MSSVISYKPLPFDILEEVFKNHCAEFSLKTSVIRTGRPPRPSQPYGAIVSPTLNAALTCFAWGRVALATPVLWSKLSIDLACNTPHFRDNVKLFLRRSNKGLPGSRSTFLTLKIELDKDAINFDPEHAPTDSDEDNAYYTDPELQPLPEYLSGELPEGSRKLSKLLLRENHRWHDVAFYLDWELFDNIIPKQRAPILKLVNTHGDATLSQLQKLELTWDMDEKSAPQWDLDSGRVLFFEWLAWGASSLHTLCLSQLRPEVYDMCLGFPSSNHLRSLVVDGWMVTSLMDVLEVFRDCSGIQAVNLPIDGVHEDPASLTRSSPHLQNLTISGNLLKSDEELIALLRLVPQINHLALDFQYPSSQKGFGNLWTEHLLRRLTWNKPDTFLPSLTSLDVTVDCSTREAHPLLLPGLVVVRDMLRSRLNPSSPTDENNVTTLRVFNFTGRGEK
ncbi:hypothetical protein D9758_004141 [Tetrapyrgos nigripes]|uniref:Uncharacterized protein n=1 Tax=Tetrapyrgos nigripes TaxID=182062 RepID=A0A8H5GU62_9AGAR|nr:hypothetical protein D9758_004141 [Tetrapyrgos nigripes]